MNIARCGVELWAGAESMGYELTSDRLSITVADLGAHLASVVMRIDGDDELEVSVPYPAGAEDGRGSHGASVGRYANRIARSSFELDGTVHELEPNEGVHQLHGGPEGFASHAWSAEAETVDGVGRVTLRHKSKSGDQGFPGKVTATAVYELDDDQLIVTYRAVVTEPTPVNLTNHVYWNLGGAGPLDDHELTLAGASYVETDEENIPLPGPPLEVRGTRFNCQHGRRLSDVVRDGGYDHCFVLDRDAAVHATLAHASGRMLTVHTNQVGMQAYTGQHLAVDNRGIALEAQCLPDTPNRPDFGDSTVRPGDAYEAVTTFTLST